MSAQMVTTSKHQQSARDNPFKGQKCALVGYGLSGQSCAHYLLSHNAKLSVFDTQLQSDLVATLSEQFEGIDISFYQLNASSDLSAYDWLIVSPGVDLSHTYIKDYIALKGRERVLGDIELFALEINKMKAQLRPRIVAVTGSNGKSSVVDMLGQALEYKGFKLAVGGNFGIPALSLLEKSYQIIVLELSSFQLESTFSLKADVACLLNVSSDHLDRHGTLENYAEIKHRIFKDAKYGIYNVDDALCRPIEASRGLTQYVGFSGNTKTSNTDLRADSKQQVNLEHEKIWHIQQGNICKLEKVCVKHEALGAISDFQQLNIMSVLACIDVLGVKLDDVIQRLLSYKGLPHRFQKVKSLQNILWINDSKATNPGAAIEAVKSASKNSDVLVLIAGGDAKGADMSELLDVIQAKVDYLILMGKDKHRLMHSLVNYKTVQNLKEAAEKASKIATLEHLKNANTKVTVLLSPACASIDMFANYQERGHAFVQALNEQVLA